MPHEQADFPLAPFPKYGFLQVKAYIHLHFVLFFLVCYQSNLSIESEGFYARFVIYQNVFNFFQSQ